MKLALTLSSAALVVASPVHDVAIEFGVEEGMKIEKTIVHEANFELVSGSRRMGDEEIEMPADFAMSLEHVRSLTVVDVYGAPLDGAPVSLTRTVVELEDVLTGEIIEGSDQIEKVNLQMEAGLVDVPISWSLEDENYVAAFAEKNTDLDDELLGGLTFDLSGLGLLPPKGADLTEGWEIPAAALGELLQLGGAFGETPVEVPGDPGEGLVRGVMFLPLLGELEGGATLVLESYDEEKGLAKIKIEVEATSEASALDLVRSITKDLDDDRRQLLEEVLLETQLDLEGTMVWDVRAGRLARLEIDGDGKREMTVTTLGPDGEPGAEIDLVFEAEASWVAEFE